jgi:hypothetical protein
VVAALLFAAPAGAAADGKVPAPFRCPAEGPNGGHAPQAMANTAGTILLLCADLEAPEGPGQLTSSAAVFDSAALEPPRPIWTATSPAGRFRIEAVADRGFSVTTESLLPRATGAYDWTPISTFEVRCEDGRCGKQPSHCAFAVPTSERRDLFGLVRQATRATPVSNVLQRLADDLAMQALLGDDAATWALVNLDAIAHVDGSQREILANARAVLDEAKDAACDAFRPWQEPPPVPFDPKELAARVRTPSQRAASPDPSPPPERKPQPEGSTEQSLDGIAWLVGGTWTGSGSMPDGRTVEAEESYRWGPGRHSIRFVAKTGGGGFTGSKADGVIFFEAAAGKVVLWNIRPQGGLSESVLTRSDTTACTFQGRDGRSIVTRNGREHLTRSVQQLQGADWTPMVTLQLERKNP